MLSQVLPFFKGKIVLANTLRAYDAESGIKLWENTSIRGKTASPILWGRMIGRIRSFAILQFSFLRSPETGETLWEGPWRCFIFPLFQAIFRGPRKTRRGRLNLLYSQTTRNL